MEPNSNNMNEPQETQEPQETGLTGAEPVEPSPQATPPAGDPPVGDPPAGDPPPAADTSWLDKLPEEIRGHERLSGVESVEDLAKKYSEAELAPTVPGVDEYKLPEGLPTEFGKAAHELKMSQEQLDGALQAFGQYDQARHQATQQALAAAADAKIKEWGDSGKENLLIAKRALNHFDPEGKFKKLLNDTGYGNHPDVIEFFYKRGLDLKEGGFINSMPNTPQGQKSAAATLYPNLASKEN